MNWLKFLFICIFIPATSIAEDWSELYQKASPSIPVILANGGICAGALVNATTVLTAAHCVDRLRSIRILWNEKGMAEQRASVIYMDHINDVAFLRLNTAVKGLVPLSIASTSAMFKAGQAIATIGHPVTIAPFSNNGYQEDSTHILSTGVISRANPESLIVDLSLSPGNSGGPVINSSGQIVGVISKKRAGFMIGNIGYVSSASVFQDAWNRIKKGELDTPVSPLRAKSSFDMGLAWERASWLNSQLLDNEVRFWYFNLDIKDRLRLRWETSSNSDLNVNHLGLGWKFEHNTGLLGSWYWIPILEMVTVNNEVFNDSNKLAYSMILQAAGSPLWIKLSTYPLNNEQQTSFALGLDIF